MQISAFDCNQSLLNSLNKWVDNETPLNIQYQHTKWNEEGKRTVDKQCSKAKIIRVDSRYNANNECFLTIIVQLGDRLKSIGLNQITYIDPTLTETGNVSSLKKLCLETICEQKIDYSNHPAKALVENEVQRKINLLIRPKYDEVVKYLQSHEKKYSSNNYKEELAKYDVRAKNAGIIALARLVKVGYPIEKIHADYQAQVKCALIDLHLNERNPEEALKVFRSLPDKSFYCDSSFSIDRIKLKLFASGCLPFDDYQVYRLIDDYYKTNRDGTLYDGTKWYETVKHATPEHCQDVRELCRILYEECFKGRPLPTDTRYFTAKAEQVLRTGSWHDVPQNDAYRVMCKLAEIHIDKGQQADALGYYNTVKDCNNYIPNIIALDLLTLKMMYAGYIPYDKVEINRIAKEHKPSMLDWYNLCRHATPEVVSRLRIFITLLQNTGKLPESKNPEKEILEQLLPYAEDSELPHLRVFKDQEGRRVIGIKEKAIGFAKLYDGKGKLALLKPSRKNLYSELCQYNWKLWQDSPANSDEGKIYRLVCRIAAQTFKHRKMDLFGSTSSPAYSHHLLWDRISTPDDTGMNLTLTDGKKKIIHYFELPVNPSTNLLQIDHLFKEQFNYFGTGLIQINSVKINFFVNGSKIEEPQNVLYNEVKHNLTYEITQTSLSIL